MSKIDPYYSSDEWIKLRKETCKRDNNTCMYCGEHPAYQADHVIPRGRGGKDNLSNLKCSCANCNKFFGGKVYGSFKEKKQHLEKTKEFPKKRRMTAMPWPSRKKK